MREVQLAEALNIELWTTTISGCGAAIRRKGPIVKKKTVISFLLKQRSFPPPDCVADSVSHLVIPLKHTCTAQPPHPHPHMPVVCLSFPPALHIARILAPDLHSSLRPPSSLCLG